MNCYSQKKAMLTFYFVPTLLHYHDMCS